MRITILIPCYNEEGSVRQSAASWLNQTRSADEIVVVDDCSNDKTAEELHAFIREVGATNITVVRTPRNTGNKSSAQEYGLNFVTGDVLITTDGDTLLDPHFVENIERDFQDPTVAAVAGYVRSLKYNWLTACRALDYAVGQNIDKLAQHYMNYLFVIPGAAGAFRTDIFKNELKFDHDVLAEDLDLTYKLHRLGYRIIMTGMQSALRRIRKPAILYQSNASLVRGGCNALSNTSAISRTSEPWRFEFSLMCAEGLTFSLLILILPFVSLFLGSTCSPSSS